jgi:hypothetical protein
MRFLVGLAPVAGGHRRRPVARCRGLRTTNLVTVTGASAGARARRPGASGRRRAAARRSQRLGCRRMTDRNRITGRKGIGQCRIEPGLEAATLWVALRFVATRHKHPASGRATDGPASGRGVLNVGSRGVVSTPPHANVLSDRPPPRGRRDLRWSSAPHAWSTRTFALAGPQGSAVTSLAQAWVCALWLSWPRRAPRGATN